MNAHSILTIVPILINGQEIRIRPTRPDDNSLQTEFAEQLSTQATQYRSFGKFRKLSDDEIRTLCDPNYHNSMAFVAVIKKNNQTREVGVVRYIKHAASGAHEMALSVADDFRLTTLGRTLVEYLVAYGKKHQVKVLFTVDSNDNIDMRNLAEQMGMSVRLDQTDAHQVIYSLSVDTHPETVVL